METITPRAGADVLVGTGTIRLAVRPQIHFRTRAGDVDLDGTITFSEDRYVVSRLQLLGTLDADALRTISFPSLIGEVLEHERPRVVRVEGNRKRTIDLDELVDDADAWTIALHLIASVSGENPNVIIAADLGCSVEAAAQRVARLRKRGLIPPARTKGAAR